MADVHTKETRSFNMSQIRSKNTKPELVVRKFLHKKGLRFRIHVKTLPGKPDIILPKFKTVVLVNGCFWHGHEGCKLFRTPRSRIEWWTNKIQNNKNRDVEIKFLLEKLGFRVFIIWECQLKEAIKETYLNSLLSNIKEPF